MITRRQIQALDAYIKSLFFGQGSTTLQEFDEETAPIEQPPTERNKPSAGSSITSTQAMGIANKMAYTGGGLSSLVANTNSMEPSIDANCVLRLEPITATSLQRQPITVGDIISYDGSGSKIRHFKNKNILHRVVAIDGDYYKLKGDNNFKSDGWIHKDFFLYRLVSIIYTRKYNNED